MEKARRFGIDAYNAEQAEKAGILEVLLFNYNDGRKKTLFCAAVNLLEPQELQTVLREIDRKPDIETMTLKEKSAFVAGLSISPGGDRGCRAGIRSCDGILGFCNKFHDKICDKNRILA